MRLRVLIVITIVAVVAALALPAAAAPSRRPTTSAGGGGGGGASGGPSALAVTLYDQLDNDSADGVTSQNFEADFDSFDAQAADDFVIPAGETWSITDLTIPGVGAGGMPSANVWFHANSGTLPGAVEYTALSVVPVDTFGDLAITLPVPAVLGPGTHWVSVQANVDFAGGQWFWSSRTVQANSESAWQNPGDGFGTGCTTWSARGTTCGITPSFPDHLFALQGDIVGGDADLTLTKGDSRDPVTEGETFTYGLRVTNAGPDPATGVTLVDTLPSEVSFVSAIPGQGTCDHVAGVVECDLGTIQPPNRVQVQINVTAETAGSATNTATVTANESDPTSPNQASTTTTINAAPNGNARTLTVVKQRINGGMGNVVSQPKGAIACGTDCTEVYGDGATVVLKAVTRSGSTFGGWGGDCAHAGLNPTCTLVMDADKTVTATFTV